MQANKLYLHTNLNNFFSSLKDCQKAKGEFLKLLKRQFIWTYIVYIFNRFLALSYLISRIFCQDFLIFLSHCDRNGPIRRKKCLQILKSSNQVFLNSELQMQPEFVIIMQNMVFVKDSERYVLLHMLIRSRRWLL